MTTTEPTKKRKKSTPHQISVNGRTYTRIREKAIVEGKRISDFVGDIVNAAIDREEAGGDPPRVTGSFRIGK